CAPPERDVSLRARRGDRGPLRRLRAAAPAARPVGGARRRGRPPPARRRRADDSAGRGRGAGRRSAPTARGADALQDASDRLPPFARRIPRRAGGAGRAAGDERGGGGTAPRQSRGAGGGAARAAYGFCVMPCPEGESTYQTPPLRLSACPVACPAFESATYV